LEALLVRPQKELCFGCHAEPKNEMSRFSLHTPFAKGNCVKCHRPHQAKLKALLKESPLKGQLCKSCHNREKLVKGVDDADLHEPFSRGECQTCHSSHAADYSFLLKKKSGLLCLTCHADTGRDIDKNSVKHEPVKNRECVACHSAHGSTIGKNLLKEQPELCVFCHQETTKFWQEGAAHEPAKEDCMTCHSAHGSDYTAILLTSKSKQCIECHEIEDAAFVNAHKGIKPGAGSCLGCHNPHGGPDKRLLHPISHSPFQEGNCRPCHPGGAK
jgi:predicted CXXCH cytochrome family protein